MNTLQYVLPFWLAAASAGILRADDIDMPVVFARSGRKAAVSLPDEAGRSVALWAFGRQWGDPLTVNEGKAEFVGPDVRMPQVFQLIPTEGGRRAVGECVVYPDRPLPWDKDLRDIAKDIQVAAVATPEWFDTWSAAVGLTVRRFPSSDALETAAWRVPDKKPVVILGPKTAEEGFAAVSRLAVRQKVNMLVLTAGWRSTSETAIRDIAITPRQMIGPLADLQPQQWPQPPTFAQHVLNIVNRQTWIAGPQNPWVEELRSPQKGAEPLRTVYSYVPWQRQLGRTETTDTLLLRLLTETAKGAKDRPPLDSKLCLLWPPVKDVKPGERPVLAAAIKAAERSGDAVSCDPTVYVLDLRGKPSIAADFVATDRALKSAQAKIGPSSRLLILGDHPILDTWEWLALDRKAPRSLRPGVVWWPDNGLPPSTAFQLRLMELFTEWNLSLGDPQEARNEDR